MARRSLAGDATAGAASRVRFAPTSNNLLVSLWDSGLRLYDADEGTLRVSAESEAALLDCCFQDESSAFACGSDGSVRRYDFHSGSQDTVGLHEDVLACIEFSLMTGQVMTGSLDKKLMLWDLKTRNVSPSGTIILDSDVASLSICGMYILAAVARNVYFYDMRNLTTPVNEKDCPLEYSIRCLHASSKWNAYVAGSVDGAVALKYLDRGTDRDMGTNQNQYKLSIKFGHLSGRLVEGTKYAFRCHPKSRNGRSNLVPVNCIAVNPCKKTFVTGDDEGCTIAWDAHSKRKLIEIQWQKLFLNKKKMKRNNIDSPPQLPTYLGSVASMAYNHNGQLLAVASNYILEVDKELNEHHQVFIETEDFKGESHVG